MNTQLLKQAFQKRKDEMTGGIWNVDFLELVKNVKKWNGYDVANAPQHVKNEFVKDSIKHYNINQDLLNECSFTASKKMWLSYLGEDTKQEKPKQLNENKYNIQQIENLIQNALKTPYRNRKEIENPLGFVFRVVSEGEFKKIMSGYYSGSFWSSDPIEYLEYLESGDYLLIAKPEGPKKFRGKERKHYHNLEKREVDEITFIYSVKGNGTSRKLIKIYP